jgi:hypothetical protein
MTDQPPSPREVIADLLDPDLLHGIGPSATAERLLESLRSRGYVVVPREPTNQMMDQGTDPLYWPHFLPSRLVREVWMWMLYGAGAISKEEMLETKERIRRLVNEEAANPGGGGKG